MYLFSNANVYEGEDLRLSIAASFGCQRQWLIRKEGLGGVKRASERLRNGGGTDGRKEILPCPARLQGQSSHALR